MDVDCFYGSEDQYQKQTAHSNLALHRTDNELVFLRQTASYLSGNANTRRVYGQLTEVISLNTREAVPPGYPEHNPAATWVTINCSKIPGLTRPASSPVELDQPLLLVKRLLLSGPSTFRRSEVFQHDRDTRARSLLYSYLVRVDLLSPIPSIWMVMSAVVCITRSLYASMISLKM